MESIKETISPIEFEEKIFMLPVVEEYSGYVSVKARTLKEAIEKFNENIDNYDTPSGTEYVDSSFRLATQDLEEMKEIALIVEDK